MKQADIQSMVDAENKILQSQFEARQLQTVQNMRYQVQNNRSQNEGHARNMEAMRKQLESGRFVPITVEEFLKDTGITVTE